MALPAHWIVSFVRRLCAKTDRVRYGIDIYRSTADRVNNNKGINHGRQEKTAFDQMDSGEPYHTGFDHAVLV